MIGGMNPYWCESVTVSLNVKLCLKATDNGVDSNVAASLVGVNTWMQFKSSLQWLLFKKHCLFGGRGSWNYDYGPCFLKQTNINRFMSCKYPDLFQSAVNLF